MRENHGEHRLIRIPEGEELLEYIRKYVAEKGIPSATFTGIGGCRSATIGYFDFQERKYLEKKLDGQLEIVSLMGNVALLDGEPLTHAHVVLGDRKYRAHAGHLIRAEVHPFVELAVTSLPHPVEKIFDSKKGLYMLRA